MKNDILLIIPPANLYPMGTAYVASVLEKDRLGYDVYGFYYDNSAWFKSNSPEANGHGLVRNISANQSIEALYELVADKEYSYILIGGLVGFFRWFYTVIPPLKGHSPASRIIMGGGITKDLSENILFEKLGVDYILRGEAETNLSQFLGLLQKGETSNEAFSDVPGLCWKDTCAAVRKNSVVRSDIIENPVLPAWDSLNVERYIELSDTLFRFNKTFFPVLVGRGCPNVCAFCSPSVGKFSACTIDSVIEEMKHWRSRYDFDFFFIYSEVAFEDDEYTREFCNRYRDEIGLPWMGQIRTDVKFTEETYRVIKESGCMFIGMGFESSNDRVLKKMRKNATFEDHLRNLTQAKKAGLNVFGNFMFGHDTETAEEIRETFDFLRSYDLINSPANGLASIITYPGTGYYKNAEKEGKVADPFKFLLSYSMKAGISNVNLRNIVKNSRLNMSALSNDEFYDVICKENIDHYLQYNKRHAVKDVSAEFQLNEEPGWVFRGNCPTCGSQVTFDRKSFKGPLNISTLCDCCYYTVTIDVLQQPECKEALDNIRSELQAHKKMVFVGDAVMDLLFHGSIALDYESLLAWHNPSDPNQSEQEYFYSKRQVKLKDLPESGCDAIVTIGPLKDAHDVTGIDASVPVVNVVPEIYNSALLELVKGTKVAVVQSERSVPLTQHLQDSDCIFFQSITEVLENDELFPFVLFDPEKEQVSRKTLAMRSQYKLEQLLEPSFFEFGGFLVSNDSQ